jgi:hypothetical protein
MTDREADAGGAAEKRKNSAAAEKRMPALYNMDSDTRAKTAGRRSSCRNYPGED